MRLTCTCFALVLFGCASTSDGLRARFAKERSCPESQVSVVESGGVVYRASGCGQSAEYACGSFSSASDARGCQERGLPRRASSDAPERFPQPRVEHQGPAESPR
jgi:hypothetical protein